MPWQPLRQKPCRQLSPPQQSRVLEHAAAADPHCVLHVFCPPPGRETQKGAEPQQPPALAPTEHGSPLHDDAGDWHTPERQERPTQHGLVALHAIERPRQVGPLAVVHTPCAQVRPAQQLPVTQS